MTGPVSWLLRSSNLVCIIGHAFSLYQCGRCPIHLDSGFSGIQTAIYLRLQTQQYFFVFKKKSARMR